MSSLSVATGSAATDAELMRDLRISIQQFGQINPVRVSVNRFGGFKLIDGALRLQACWELGITKVEAHDQSNRRWLLMWNKDTKKWRLEVPDA